MNVRCVASARFLRWGSASLAVLCCNGLACPGVNVSTLTRWSLPEVSCPCSLHLLLLIASLALALAIAVSFREYLHALHAMVSPADPAGAVISYHSADAFLRSQVSIYCM